MDEFDRFLGEATQQQESKDMSKLIVEQTIAECQQALVEYDVPTVARLEEDVDSDTYGAWVESQYQATLQYVREQEGDEVDKDALWSAVSMHCKEVAVSDRSY